MTTTLKHIVETIRKVEERGVQIICLPPRANHGVEPIGPPEARWAQTVPHGVTPVGAALLVLQPDTELHDGMQIESAAEALNINPPWLAGFEDGFCDEPMNAYILAGLGARLYRAGYRDGVLFWGEQSVACETCGHRRHKSEPSCTPCDEERARRSEAA